jgi:hypothetical protein
MYITLTSTQTSADPWREPDVYINKDTAAFGTEEMAVADGGSWQGLWRVS